MLVLFLLISLSAVVAQPFMLGLKGGTNLTHANSPAFKKGYAWGWEAGAYTGFNIRKFGVQVELLYSWTRVKTVDYSNAKNTGIEGGRKKLDYLSMPILLRFNVTQHFTIMGGPQLNVLAGNNHKLGNGSDAFQNRYSNWVVGFEVNKPDPKKATIYGRYCWGNNFENIGDGKDASVSRFQLGVFLPFINNK